MKAQTTETHPLSALFGIVLIADIEFFDRKQFVSTVEDRPPLTMCLHEHRTYAVTCSRLGVCFTPFFVRVGEMNSLGLRFLATIG